MTPMIPTKVPRFGKWSPIAAFDFDVFDAVEEPEVLLAEVPVVAVALATYGCKGTIVSDEDKVLGMASLTHTDEEFVAVASLPLLMLEVVTQDDDGGAG